MALLSALWSVTYLALVAAAVVTVLMRKREPSSALAWSLTIVILPGLGLVLYVLFGINRVPRRLRRKIAHHEQFVQDFEFPEEGGAAQPLEGEYAPNRWGSLGSMLERLGEAPRREGNELQLYESGLEAFEAMRAAVEQARHHIHIEYFIFRDDELGRQVFDLLEHKVAQGVEVRFVVDGLGTLASWRVVDRVRRFGGQAAAFSPLRRGGPLVSPNLRTHRKIVVVDGCVAFFGGLNVGVEYLGAEGRPWHDLHARLAGPAVRDLQRMFAEDWDFCTRRLISGESYFPPLERRGEASVQIIGGGPDTRPNPVRQAYFGALTRARRRLLIATPYLVPDLALREALAAAARSSVEVTIVTQWPPVDHWTVYWCGLFWIEELLEAGVRVAGVTDGMMHAKAIAVDGLWAMTGTANLDNRSMFLNFEQMAVLDGPEEAQRVEAAIERLLARSRPYTLEHLRSLPLRQRLLVRSARLLAPLL